MFRIELDYSEKGLLGSNLLLFVDKAVDDGASEGTNDAGTDASGDRVAGLLFCLLSEGNFAGHSAALDLTLDVAADLLDDSIGLSLGTSTGIVEDVTGRLSGVGHDGASVHDGVLVGGAVAGKHRDNFILDHFLELFKSGAIPGDVEGFTATSRFSRFSDGDGSIISKNLPPLHDSGAIRVGSIHSDSGLKHNALVSPLVPQGVVGIVAFVIVEEVSGSLLVLTFSGAEHAGTVKREESHGECTLDSFARVGAVKAVRRHCLRLSVRVAEWALLHNK